MHDVVILSAVVAVNLLHHMGDLLGGFALDVHHRTHRLSFFSYWLVGWLLGMDACVHVCVSACVCIGIYVCVCVCVYRCVYGCVCDRQSS